MWYVGVVADKKRTKGKVTPISDQMAKAAPSPTLDQTVDPLVLPVSMAARKVTARSISNGSYQSALRAIFAPQILPQLFRSLMSGIQSGDPVKMRQGWEIYQMLGGKGGVNINLQQNNVNQTANVSASRSKEISSPDDMFRVLAEEREHRLLTAGRPVVDLVATPVEYEGDKVRQE